MFKPITEKELKITRKFISLLFKKSDRVNFTALCEQAERKAFVINDKAENIIKEINLENINRWKENWRNVCICPNPLKEGESRSAANILELNAIYIDIDGKKIDIKNINPKPHFIFKRGKNHYHIYWLLKRIKADEKSLGKFSQIENYFIELLGADKAVKDASRLLRLPYTYHQKKPGAKGDYYEPVLFTENPIRYDLNELHKLCGKSEITTREEKKIVENYQTQPEETTKNFILNSFLERETKRQGEGRSKELFFIGLDCFSWGLKKENAYEIARKISDERFDPPESEKVIKHQIDSAYKYHRGSFGENKETIALADNAKAHVKALKQFKEFVKIRDTLKTWVYILSAERFIDLESGQEWTNAAQIQNGIAYLCSTLITFSVILSCGLVRVVEGLDFRPDIPQRIYKQKNKEYFNRFIPIDFPESDLNSKDAKYAIEFFQNHLKYLTTSDYEYKMLLNFLAFVVQHPGEKLPYAVLLLSKKQGIGKSLLEKLFRNIFDRYVGTAENSEITDNWTHYMVDKILIFIHELYQSDREAAVNKLKSRITEEYYTVNTKNARQYESRNTVNFIMFSNHIDAVRLPKEDRRFLVIYTETDPQPAEYYDELVNIFDNCWAILYNYLLSVDLSKFNPYQRPEITEGKRHIIEQSTGELEYFLNPYFQTKTEIFENPFVLIRDIENFVHIYGSPIIKYKTGMKAIRKYLVEKGFSEYSVIRRIQKHRIHNQFWSLYPIEAGNKKHDAIILKVLQYDNEENKKEEVEK